MVFEVLVHVQGVEVFGVEAGEQHVHHDGDVDFVFARVVGVAVFVVFDALYDKKISIKRAIAPFDSQDFANGMMEDIDLIFFKPAGSIIKSGLLKNGAAVCRYQKPDGRIVDIISYGQHKLEIKLYLPDNRLVRTVNVLPAAGPESVDRKGISNKIELKAHGSPGYELAMELVEAIPLTK